MIDDTIEIRIEAYNAKESSLEEERKELATELGEALADRLLELFSSRDEESRQRWPTFERWLSAQFSYEYFEVFDLFKADPELKQLVDYVDKLGRFNRSQAALVVNRRIKAAGYAVGIHTLLNDIVAVRPF